MRGIALLIGLGALTSCTTGPVQPAPRSAQGQHELDRLVAGKVAGPPLHCLQSYDMQNMVAIDDSTVVYRSSGSRVFVNHMQGYCGGVGGNAVMVTKSVAGSQTCRGDIATMVDPFTHAMTGSCSFGDFIPYTKPR
jgi:hypothetical protein